MKAKTIISFIVLLMVPIARAQCPATVTISGVYAVPYTGSNTWIASNGSTTIQPSSSLVLLDANPVTDGYVLLDVGFEAQYGSTFQAVVVTPCSLLSVNDLNVEVDLEVYPNPTTGEIHFEVFNDDLSDLQIDITNQLGQRIVQLDKEMFIDKKALIDLSEFEAGLYFIITNLAGQTAVERIVKL